MTEIDGQDEEEPGNIEDRYPARDMTETNVEDEDQPSNTEEQHPGATIEMDVDDESDLSDLSDLEDEGSFSNTQQDEPMDEDEDQEYLGNSDDDDSMYEDEDDDQPGSEHQGNLSDPEDDEPMDEDELGGQNQDHLSDTDDDDSMYEDEDEDQDQEEPGLGRIQEQSQENIKLYQQWAALPACKFEGNHVSQGKMRTWDLADLLAEVERLGDAVNPFLPGPKASRSSQIRNGAFTIQKYIVGRHDLAILCRHKHLSRPRRRLKEAPKY